MIIDDLLKSSIRSVYRPAAGVEMDKRGYIKANGKLETSVAGIYAIGDVKGGPAFTHISYNDYLILYKNLVEGKDESIQDRMVPYTMFTDPQLGRVGITEQEARENNLNIRVATLPMAHVARAIETGDTREPDESHCGCQYRKNLGSSHSGPGRR